MKSLIPNLEYCLTIKAAWLSNVKRNTLTEIASILDLSTIKVHRMLNNAEQIGLLKTWVDIYPDDCIKLAQEIKNKFSLSSCLVVPDTELDNEQSINIVGFASAQKVFEHIKMNKPSSIGIDKGRTLKQMALALPRFKNKNIQFIATSGSMKQNYSIMKEDVIDELVRKTHGQNILLLFPHYAKNLKEKRSFLDQVAIQKLHERVLNTEIMIAGATNIIDDIDAEHYRLINNELWSKAIEQGACTDFLGILLDINGNPVDAINDLSLGLTLKDLRTKAKNVVAIIGGKNKGSAALSILRTGVLSELIIGETSAKILQKKLEDLI